MKKYFFIRTDGKYVKLCFSEILYAEGSRNYIKIFTETKQYLVLITMKRLEQFLPTSLFIRIHKSFIVSLEKIVQFDKERVWLQHKELPVGHQYRNELVKSVLIVNDAEYCCLPTTSTNYVDPIRINSYHQLVEAG
ncbi:MAG TPA: LytTR family DNA-binding domain-containing protein [Chitinophagaceae bacterium]|nr:LytTR family DNA-binding domain-containing protein [Chitinophagaceae bacterium]